MSGPTLDVELELLLEAVARGTPQRFIARGASMGGALPDGTLVWLHPISRPELGDVVAAITDAGLFVVHRVVGVRADGSVLLKGDANPRPDGWLRPAQVRARVEVRAQAEEVWA